jgi:hypothetical protein
VSTSTLSGLEGMASVVSAGMEDSVCPMLPVLEEIVGVDSDASTVEADVVSTSTLSDERLEVVNVLSSSIEDSVFPIPSVLEKTSNVASVVEADVVSDTVEVGVEETVRVVSAGIDDSVCSKPSVLDVIVDVASDV